MREDFHKVIIERPRWGSRIRNYKTRWSTRTVDPDGDAQDPSPLDLNRKAGRKSFSDHLAPLRRYLATQVGRPWSKIEGQFKKAVDTRTLIGRHLWDHALEEVELECWIHPDGRPRTLRGYPVRNLYVHPRTGLLLRPKPCKSDPFRARQRRLAQAKEAVLDEKTRAEKIGDLWYLFIDEGRTEESVGTRRDRSGKMIRFHTSKPVIRRKQASTEEIRRIRAAIEAAVT